MSVIIVSFLVPLVAIIMAGIVAVIVLKHEYLDEGFKVGILIGIGFVIFMMGVITAGMATNYVDKFYEIKMKELNTSIQLLD